MEKIEKKEKKKRYLALKISRKIVYFPFSSITEFEDYSNCPEHSHLLLILNNGSRFEINNNVEMVKGMILEDWMLDGEILEVDKEDGEDGTN